MITASMETATHERLRRAAVQAVETWPGIEAVVLFGSRARGTAHPRSDWDVAILSRATVEEERAACALLAGLGRVIPLVVPPAAIRRYRDHGMRLEAAIARQGRLLAGAWVRPDCLKEGLEVEPMELKEGLDTTTMDIENAIGTLCSAAEDGTAYVPNAVELSQQAAEGIAKSVIAGFGLSPATVHDLDALATQLEEAYRGRRQGEEDRKLFAGLIRELDGNTLAAHTARYSRQPVEMPERTVDRLVGTLRLQISWIRYYAERLPEAEPAVREVGRQIARTARRLGRREGFERLTPTLQAATAAWGDDGESIASRGATVRALKHPSPGDA